MTFFKQIYFFGSTQNQPFLEIKVSPHRSQVVPFHQKDQGNSSGEQWWQALPSFPIQPTWKFRILINGQVAFPLRPKKYHTSRLTKVWIQNQEVFDYPPLSSLSPSQVIKVDDFQGSLPPRPLYIYLPRGYAEQTKRHYPVIYMHDGQNCFETFAGDSFCGSWKADRVADKAIAQSLMQECLIVGVGHGGETRLKEYLPPYAHLPLKKEEAKHSKKTPRFPQKGHADQTLRYYREEVIPYIDRHYRTLKGPEFRATCGSSLGGLFSHYLAWEFPSIARQHAILSPSYWATRNSFGKLAAIEQILAASERPNMRFWLDSGTQSAPGSGDDGMEMTLKARDAFFQIGYKPGKDFRYYLAKGAIHHESAWSARLPLVFQFLFPLV